MAAAVQDAKALAAEARQRAGEAAETVKDKAGSLVDEARAQGEEILGTARERAESLAEEQKAMGAEKASKFADAIRHAAQDLEGASPEVARHVRSAADSVQGIASALRDRSAGQLFDDATAFARSQPTAFFGVAALAGFALARFMKSSAPRHHMSGAETMGGSAHVTPGWVQATPGHSARPATMAGASLGGAAAHHSGEARPGSMPLSSPSPAMPASPASSGQHASGPMANERSSTPL
jgi:vacuolar-type H+-ATPase subunit H